MSAHQQLEDELFRLLFGRQAHAVDGLDERAQKVYRRQVRRSLMGGVRLAIPIACRLLADEQLDDLLARWLAEAPPTTRLYWQLPLEFAAWLREVGDLPHPALADLVHWEALEVDVRNAPEPDAPVEGGVALDPSARLGIYHYPVFRMDSSTTGWPEALDAPAFVLAYRRDETVYWRLLDAPLAQTLARLDEGDSLDEALDFIAELYGAIDRDAITDGVDDLVEKGAVRRA